MASKDFNTLDERLAKVALRLDKNITALMFNLIRLIGIAVVIATPVLTGLARGNWRASLNLPIPTATTLLDKSGAQAIAQIEAVARSWRIGQTAFITNRLDYIETLNSSDSPSKQAPPRFIQIAIKKGVTASLTRQGTGLL